MTSPRTEIWPVEGGRWRWSYVEPGTDGRPAVQLASHKEYLDRQAARDAAQTAYPELEMRERDSEDGHESPRTLAVAVAVAAGGLWNVVRRCRPGAPRTAPAAAGTDASSATSVRGLSAVRAAWGLLLLTHPRAVLSVVDGRALSDVDVAVARLLAGRHVVQAGVTVLVPRLLVLRLGAVADGLHAATGVGLAATAPAWRRTGLLDATLAGAFGAVTWRASSTSASSERASTEPSSP